MVYVPEISKLLIIHGVSYIERYQIVRKDV
jgi:hypothetical protein